MLCQHIRELQTVKQQSGFLAHPVYSILDWFVVEPEHVVVQVDNFTSSSSSSTSAAPAVTICWYPPQVGDIAKYELNVAFTAFADVGQRRPRQIWIDATDIERHDNVVGGRHCHQLDPASLPPGQLHFILLRPWTTGRRPGSSVVALFSISGS